jgi:hypothetical protein
MAKMKHRLFLLAAAGIAGSVSVAAAQPAPAPAPPPPAAPASPGAQPPAAAPAQPAPEQPAPGQPAPGQPPPAAPGQAGAPADPAGAQPPAPPAPSVPAPAPPEAAAPPVPPPAAPPAPAAPPPPAPVVWSTSGSVPGADTVASSDEPTPLPWHDSTFTWNHAATTTILGVGRDNIGGDGEYYGWDFTLRPRFYFIEEKQYKLFALGEIGWATELTNSDTATDQRETLFKDTLLGVRYQRTLWESGGKDEGEYSATFHVTPLIVLPTSPASYEGGKYFSAGLGSEFQPKIKLLGKSANGLNNVTGRFGLTYSHLFSESYTPVSSDLQRPRQNATGDTILGDQLTGTSFEIDRLTVLLGFILPVYKDLQLLAEFRWINGWTHEWEPGGGTGCDVAILNDPCVVAGRTEEDPVNYRVSTIVQIGLNYPIYEVVEVGLGYQNESPQVGPLGERRNMFYSPDAQFFLDITANLDKIYAKVTRRSEAPASAAIKPAKREF